MNSDYYYSLLRLLYKYHSRSAAVLMPRLVAIFRTGRTVLANPKRFLLKPFILIFKNPRKLASVAIGDRTIQDWKEAQKELTADYNEWLQKTNSDEANQDLGKKPLISIITPVYNPPAEAFRQLVESVLTQSYDHFELLLYSFGTDKSIDDAIDEYARKDNRVKAKTGLKNGGISDNSNLCLKDVSGEFVGLLDHDDELTPNALYECARAINDDNPDFIYSDKDKITEAGERFEPLFKPDWSPELALVGNYMTHFTLMRTELINKIGGWDPNTDGAQDWDLFLRIIEKSTKIKHIPKILYHWRTVAGSTANEITAKPYVIEAQKLAIQKHLQTLGLNAEPYHDPDGQLYIKWQDKAQKQAYVIHLQHKNIKGAGKLAKDISQLPDFQNGSELYIFVLNNDLSSKQRVKLQKINSRIRIVEYKPGSFVQMIADTLKNTDFDSVIYMLDSIKRTRTLNSGAAWTNQLSGWLDIPDVNIAGGLSLSTSARVVDCGSFFDSKLQKFYKFYFGTGFRSGFIGPLQWTRNLILPSERLFVFNKNLLDLLYRQNGLINVADQEFPTALALINHTKGGRAVYDYTVVSTDSAPFYLSAPNSSQLSEYLINNCKNLLKNGDPFYNPNLDDNYLDPTPKTKDSSKKQLEFGVFSADV